MTNGTDLIRLTYVSEHDFKPDAQGNHPAFLAIDRSAVARNGAHGVTGFLICAGSWFAQVLEGPAASVDEIYALIVSDERHRAIRLVERVPADRRLFPDWNMALGHATASTEMVFAALDFPVNAVPDPSLDDRIVELASDLAAVRRITR